MASVPYESTAAYAAMDEGTSAAGRFFSERPRQNETACGIVAAQKSLSIYHAAN
jgi:hypothetical protein